MVCISGQKRKLGNFLHWRCYVDILSSCPRGISRTENQQPDPRMPEVDLEPSLSGAFQKRKQKGWNVYMILAIIEQPMRTKFPKGLAKRQKSDLVRLPGDAIMQNWTALNDR